MRLATVLTHTQSSKSFLFSPSVNHQCEVESRIIKFWFIHLFIYLFRVYFNTQPHITDLISSVPKTRKITAHIYMYICISSAIRKTTSTCFQGQKCIFSEESLYREWHPLSIFGLNSADRKQWVWCYHEEACTLIRTMIFISFYSKWVSGQQALKEAINAHQYHDTDALLQQLGHS